MHVPKVTVLIPIYNVEAYLGECLDSLREQTFSDFEAICINDGSTDRSGDIIAEFVRSDTRFRAIEKANSGYGASMNRGLDEAIGEYVAILESDDSYAPDALERLYRAITTADAEVARANCHEYWAGPPTKTALYELVPREQVGRLVNPQVEHEILYMPPAIWSGLYRRDFIERNAIRFLETPGASYQDTSWGFKVWANATRAIYLGEALVNYRQDNQGSSVKSQEKAYYVVEEYAEMLRYVSSRDAKPWLMDVMARMKFGTYLWNYERLADDMKLGFLTYASQEFAEQIDQGCYGLSQFDAWHRALLEMLIRSPEEFHSRYLPGSKLGRLGKARLCLQVGGIGLLAKVAIMRLFGHAQPGRQ
jgi:glycosyltransferase involved in cell wall biosynthesis